MFLSVALVALLIPGLALACHVVDVEGNADCNGWSLCTTVYFTSNVDSGELAYTVTVMEATGEEITSFGETLTITHEPGAGNYTYCFEGVWEGEHMAYDPIVEITSSLDGQYPTTFTFDLDCTVDEDAASFGSLKAQYR